MRRIGVRLSLLTILIILPAAVGGQAHGFYHKSFHKNLNNGVNNHKIRFRDDVKAWTLFEAKSRYASGTSLQIRARLLSGDQDESSENFQAGAFYLLRNDMVEMLRDLKLEPAETQDDGDTNGAFDNTGHTKNDHKSVINSLPPISSGAYLEAAARILLTDIDYSQKPDGAFSAVEAFGQLLLPAITLQSEANEASGTHEENQLLALLIYAKLAEQKSVKIESNAFGWEQNTKVCAGDYFLFGYALFDDQLLVWQVPVKILPGRNAAELDQYNAEVITEF